MKHKLILIFLLFLAKTIFAQDTEQKVKYAFGAGFEYAFGDVDIYPVDGSYSLHTSSVGTPISHYGENGETYYGNPDHKTYTSFVNFKAIFPKVDSDSWGMVLNTELQKKLIYYWDIDFSGEFNPEFIGKEPGQARWKYWEPKPFVVKVQNEYIYQNAWALNTSLMFERRIWDKLNLGLGAQIGFNFDYENCYLGSRGYLTAIDTVWDDVGNLTGVTWDNEKKSGEWRMGNYPELMPITYGLNGSLNYPVKLLGLNLLPEARFRYEMTHKIVDPTHTIGEWVEFNVGFNFAFSCAVIF